MIYGEKKPAIREIIFALEEERQYKQMIKDAQLLQGLSKGYYKDQTLEEQKLKLEWVLDRHF